MIIFLSCVKSKQKCRCRAEEMYVSDLFKKSLIYAKQQKPRKIYILSALYGLLELDDIITPYEKTLLKMSEAERKKWACKVFKQMRDKNIDFNEEAVFLCGYQYRKYLSPKFKKSVAPLGNLGIGKQLAFYKENIK